MIFLNEMKLIVTHYAKAETPVLWPPHTKSWLIGKDSDAGRGWGQEEKGMTEDASLTRWTWVWVNSGSWWWTGRPGMLRFMESQRVGHDWATELNWTDAYSAYQFSSVQSLGCVWLFATPWTAALQAVSNAIQPSCPLLSPSPPTFSLSQPQGLFQWVCSSHQVAKVLEFQDYSLEGLMLKLKCQSIGGFAYRLLHFYIHCLFSC